MKNKGIGDVIEQITTATGIKAAVEYLEEKFDFDCGCQQRKEKLNKMFPFTVECLVEEEYEYLKSFDFNKGQLQPDEQQQLLKIYNRVFNQNQQMTGCSACWANIISKLGQLYNEYKV